MSAADTRPPAPSYGEIDRAYAARLAGTPVDEDGPVWMVNLMKYKAAATYADGTTGVTGRQADDRYAPTDVLAAIGAEVVLFGDVETQFIGDDPVWDRIGVVRYPTRRSFVEMQGRDDFRARHVHKEAGMDRTIVMACEPATVPLDVSSLPDWSAVPHPPTADDPPIVIVHVIRYAEGARRQGIEQYQQRAAAVALPHGARVGGWFDVDGTIVGDGRRWDQVRFNLFPSTAAFMAVVADPGRQEAFRTHREPAIADTYTMLLRPAINRLDGAG